MNKNTARKNIIELKHISRTFDDGFRVVDDFNLTIQRGEFVTFLPSETLTSGESYANLCLFINFLLNV